MIYVSKRHYERVTARQNKANNERLLVFLGIGLTAFTGYVALDTLNNLFNLAVR